MPVPGRPLRILLVALGGDGVELTPIARALRDAGMEVIYAGLELEPERIVDAALQEGVDVVCLSDLASVAAQLPWRVIELLRENGAGDRLVAFTGRLPEHAVREMRARGIEDGFTMGKDAAEISANIGAWSEARAAESA